MPVFGLANKRNQNGIEKIIIFIIGMHEFYKMHFFLLLFSYTKMGRVLQIAYYFRRF